MTLKQIGFGLVLVHLLVVTPHSIAHNMLGINMNSWQNIYIAAVILLAPVVACVVMWKRPKLGFLLLGLSMAGSFGFGAIYHFALPGSDNAMLLHPHPWTFTFQVSAVLLAVTELAGALVGLIGFRMSDNP